MNYLLLRKDRGNVQLQKSIQEINSKLQADCKMKLSQIDNDDDDNACFGKFIDKIELYEPCNKKLPFFEDIDGIRQYLKRWKQKATTVQKYAVDTDLIAGNS